jgi:adenylate kinase family enzyme
MGVGVPRGEAGPAGAYGGRPGEGGGALVISAVGPAWARTCRQYPFRKHCRSVYTQGGGAIGTCHQYLDPALLIFDMSQRIQVGDLLSVISTDRPRLIAIDGLLGAGKSTLAKRIEQSLGYRCVHLDDFVQPHQGKFFSSLDFSRLENGLAGEHVVVEGVCVLAVLERVGLSSDMLVFVTGREPRPSENTLDLLAEVRRYLSKYSPETRARYSVDIDEERNSWRVQIDIAYINAKTKLAMILAAGGIMALLVGAIVFVLGAQANDVTLIRFAGFEISATGLGAVILATSSVWGYLAYLSRPQYSHSREQRRSTRPDGSSEYYEAQSSTLATARKKDEIDSPAEPLMGGRDEPDSEPKMRGKDEPDSSTVLIVMKPGSGQS